MSNWRKGRYGWTREAWLAYKAKAIAWVREMEDSARQRVIRQTLIDMGAYAINED